MTRICGSACAVLVPTGSSVLHRRVEKRESIATNHAGCRGESRMTYLWLRAGGALPASTASTAWKTCVGLGLEGLDLRIT